MMIEKNVHGRPVLKLDNGVLLAAEAVGGGDLESIGMDEVILYTGHTAADPELPEILVKNVLQLGIPMLQASYNNYMHDSGDIREFTGSAWEYTHIGFCMRNGVFLWQTDHGDSNYRPQQRKYESLNKFMYYVILNYINTLPK